LKDSPESVVIFEDEAALTLEPLTLTRPVWELRCGLRTLGEKIQAEFDGVQFHYMPRPYIARNKDEKLAPEERQSNNALWINGSLIPGTGFAAVTELKEGSAWVAGNRVAAFRGRCPSGWEAGTHLPLDGFHITEAPSAAYRLLRYPWEVIHLMNGENEREARQLRQLGRIEGEIHPGAVLVKEGDIFVAPGCSIAPGAVIDASAGPVVLTEGVLIGANAVIEGPTYLGTKVQVKPLSHIRGSCLGEESHVGGEISVSIIQGFTNKQHGGFLGHSFIGSWCNLGSGTETSNLKNNYTPVKVQVGTELVETGQLFVGLMMGDHSKSAIGTIFNTGTVVGVGCNLFGSGFPPRFIPSFHWGGADKLTPYPLQPALETARTVMTRRDRELSEHEIDILKWIHGHRVS